MNLQDLYNAAKHHQELANAYHQGIEVANQVRKHTIHECIQTILREEMTPGTCAHPAKRLSPQTKDRNRIAKQIAESVAKRMTKRLAEPDDDIPF